MENKKVIKTVYIMVLEDRQDQTIEVSPFLYNARNELYEVFMEIWNETHFLVQIKEVDIEL
jgi:hypothetical protein